MKNIKSPQTKACLSFLKTIFFAVLSLGSIARAAVTDFPDLNPNHPIYGLLYTNVNPGDTTVPTSKWDISNETLNAVYAYLHPDSPHRHKPAYLNRLKLLLDFRFNEYSTGTGLGDMAGCFQATYAYMLLKHHRASSIDPDEMTAWEAAMVAFADYEIANRPLLYIEHAPADSWHNGDIRLAMAVYFAGIATSNQLYQQRGAEAIDDYLTTLVVGDGAIHKSGFQNESPSYRNWNILFMLWWWQITGSPEMEAALAKTIPWIPLMNEPEGFAEQSTSVAVKHMYNKGRGLEAALATAYLYNCPYNYFYGQQIENNLHDEWGIMHAALYQGPLQPVTPPADFILHDRAIIGPRVRTPDWLAVGTTRSPQVPDPDHGDQRYEGKQTGKNTFVGAAAIGSWANNTALKAALDGVSVEIKNLPGVTKDWARSNGDGGMYYFLAQDEQTSAISRDTFGTLSTSYRLSERTRGGAVTAWAPGTDWIGEQVWLLTKDRLVGLVQIHNEFADTVYGLDTRIVLVGGRYPILGQYLDVVEVAPDEFEFGELKVRVPQTTFNGLRTVQRTTVYGSNTADDYTALLRLHDAADTNDDTLITYPAGTRRWAVIECTRTNESYAGSVTNVLQDNNTVAVLQVDESNRRFRLVQNLTGNSRSYSGNMWGISGGTATVHKSWSDTVDVVTPALGNPVALNVQLPPYGHVILVSSSDAADHTGNVNYYEDLFTQGPGVGNPNVATVWYPLGSDVDRTFSNVSDDGFTLLFHNNSDGRSDVAAATDFTTPITLDATHQPSMVMSFTIDDLQTSLGGEGLLRIGFSNDEVGTDYDATLHYIFGYGAPGNNMDVRFAGNSNTAHIFSQGAWQDKGFLPSASPLFTGNTSQIEVRLTYLQNNGDGTHNYRASVSWDGETQSSSIITRNTETWNRAYIQTNNAIFQVAGDGFNISNTFISASQTTY